MDVNGYTINIKEDLNQFGNVNVNSGKLTVAGNYTQQDGVLDLNNGRLEVTGDYRLQGEAKDDNGETAYQTTYGGLFPCKRQYVRTELLGRRRKQ